MLLLSLITLFAGPLLFQWISSTHPLARTLDRVIVVTLVVLVVVLLIPDIVEPLGWSALGFLFVGYLLPGLLERLIRRAAETLHLLSLYVALVGLLLHAVLDGAGLAGSEWRDSGGLAVAIILHRFGMGLMLWLIMQPVFGEKIAWATLFAMAAATIIGFEFSEWLLPYAGDTLIAAIQGVIIGTIIHSLVHREHVDGAHHHPHGK
ncbi:MAG: hypothetical protein HKN57_10925 [Xanthomonadales bacterium]|nr:hypothetical protein [Gammaproteobacteria bacterium]MBT8052562.1 hypothetical protein [Gammaproteobacteria bacterium]NND57757.1 hypothetical protein [Xanthomonadales bacterium]NNK51472.1 hypothetical protein [Xanthomonadales bacterium]